MSYWRDHEGVISTWLGPNWTRDIAQVNLDPEVVDSFVNSMADFWKRQYPDTDISNLEIFREAMQSYYSETFPK